MLDFLRQRHREDLVQRRSNNNSINNNNNNHDKEKGSLPSAKDNLMSDNKFVAIELVESFAMNKPQKRPGLAHIRKKMILSSFPSFGFGRNVGNVKSVKSSEHEFSNFISGRSETLEVKKLLLASRRATIFLGLKLELL